MIEGPYSIWSDLAGYAIWGAAGFCFAGGGWLLVSFAVGAILGALV